MGRGTTDQKTHRNHLGEEDPSRVEASYQEAGGKADHRSQEGASSLEGGNQDQEEKAVGLRKVSDGWVAGSGPSIGLTSTESRRGRGSTEPPRRTHPHGWYGWWRAKMLGAKPETSRRGAAARFIGSRNLVDNALGLIVSQGY